MEQEFELIAKTFMGLEPVLAQELTGLGAHNVQQGRRMVSFTGDKEMMYRANFQLHTAIRILKPIKHFKAHSADEVYDEVKKIQWDQYLDNHKTFAIDSVVYSENFRNSLFVTYRVKDAITDWFREKTESRPNISVSNPDIRFNIHISDEDATLSLDSSGESLHRRGYRQESVEAPINEVLAAGMILMTGWRGDCDFIDPMCGSGTFLIEADLIAHNMSPGIFRKGYAFEKWPDYDQDLFDKIYNDDSKEKEFNHHIYGYDIDMKAVNTAKINIRAAGLSKDITVEQADFKDFTHPAEKSIIVMNPPYGERISTPNLLGTYKMIGERLKHAFQGNDAWIVSYREECFEQIGLKPSLKIPLYNGSLECEFRKYSIFEGRMKEFRSEGGVVKTDQEREEMAERHFKAHREFKQGIDVTQEENEEGDIRSFQFRSIIDEKKRQDEERRKSRDHDDRRFGRDSEHGERRYGRDDRRGFGDDHKDTRESYGERHFKSRFSDDHYGDHKRPSRFGSNRRDSARGDQDGEKKFRTPHNFKKEDDKE
ncbi:MAG: THUMP domain-containing protein [Prevotella sp.]|jgi:putative N6-adenine-specific DNA methylase|nr:THUMP domain-containing protein [Prevotella sp.]